MSRPHPANRERRSRRLTTIAAVAALAVLLLTVAAPVAYLASSADPVKVGGYLFIGPKCKDKWGEFIGLGQGWGVDLVTGHILPPTTADSPLSIDPVWQGAGFFILRQKRAVPLSSGS